MKNSIPRLVITALVLMISLSAQNEASGQITPGGTVGKKPPRGQGKGPIAPGGTVSNASVLGKPDFNRRAAQPKADLGYLSVVAIRGATVNLTPVAKNKKQGSVLNMPINEADGSLNLIIPPGQ